MNTGRMRRALTALLAGTLVIAGVSGCLAATPEPDVAAPMPEPEDESTPDAGALSLDALEIELEPVLDGFEQPLYVTGAGDGSGRLFVLEKTGRAWTVSDGERGTAFLDLSDRVSTESEQGLLGMAFSPSFAEDGMVFVSYTQRDGASVLSRWTAIAPEGEALGRSSAKMLLHVAQPFANHNGGMIAFGPDGYLYLGLGDGGGSGDPHGSGQNGAPC